MKHKIRRSEDSNPKNIRARVVMPICEKHPKTLNPGILGDISEVVFKSFGSANSLKYKKLDPRVVKERENNTNINEVIQKMNDYVTYNSLGGWL